MLKDSVIYGIAGSVSRFVGILLVPIYTRLFSPDEYGLLDLLVTTSWVLVLLSGMQVESGIARSYFEAKEITRDRVLVGTGVLLKVAGIAGWTVLTAAIFGMWLNGYEGISWTHVVPLLLALLPTQLLGLWQLLLRLQNRPRLFVLLSIGDVLTSAVLSVLAVVVFERGVPGVMWGLFLSKLVWALIGLKVLTESFAWAWHGGYAREVLEYGVPLVPSTLTKWAQNYANRFVLVALLTLTQVGFFSLAVKIGSAVALLDAAFRLAWDPYALQIMGQPEFERQYARMLDYYLVGMFGICAMVSALGWFGVKILAPDTYLAAANLVAFITMGLLWNGSVQILGLGISYVRKTYWSVVGFATGVIFNLVVLWFTASRWGLLTAGISYLLGAIITAVIILLISQHCHYVPYRSQLLVSVLVASVLLPFFLYLLPEPGASAGAIVINTGTRLAIAVVAWLCVAAVGINRQDKGRLLRAVELAGRGVLAR